MTVGSQVKSCFSSIKSAEATINILKSNSQNEQSKQVFNNVEKIITEIKNDLQKQVMYLSREESQYKS